MRLRAQDPRRVEPVKHFICAAFQTCRSQQRQIEKNELFGRGAKAGAATIQDRKSSSDYRDEDQLECGDPKRALPFVGS
ncbi:hypothetical protein [Bradyrhizobium brasilense]|uniref:hypothetical protein n=1 Tax=Bradyrhizobium brasilense TaxID=1419277 RepID=UPI001E2BA3BC|nr:hypothetical protein [Bradyrhizobium brasilense]MCC8949818.1 hypothetical protein [Bradyrhizobium brasilense]MCP1912165.1 hypothetical protein [Bradyrhizobium elkanii]